MVELGRGHTFITAAQVPSLERSGMAKAIEVYCLPPLRLGWAARSFASIPKAAHEFLQLFDDWSQRMPGDKHPSGHGAGGRAPEASRAASGWSARRRYSPSR